MKGIVEACVLGTPRRLYPNLDTLVNKGLVEKGQRDRRTNLYALTDRGRRELKARREWEDQYAGEILKIPAEG